MEQFIAKWRVLAEEVQTAVRSLPVEELLTIFIEKLPVNDYNWMMYWDYTTWDKTRIDERWPHEKSYEELLKLLEKE